MNHDVAVICYLLPAIFFGILQASLVRRGFGQVEHLHESAVSLGLMIISIPLAFLSNIGLIGISIWTFFEIDWAFALMTVIPAFIIFGLTIGKMLARAQSGSDFLVLAAYGIPIVLVSRVITATLVVVLILSFTNTLRL